MSIFEKKFVLPSVVICSWFSAFAILANDLSLLERLDADEDGYISLRESVSDTELLREFALIDSNEDGKVSQAELVDSGFISDDSIFTVARS